MRCKTVYGGPANDGARPDRFLTRRGNKAMSAEQKQAPTAQPESRDAQDRRHNFRLRELITELAEQWLRQEDILDASDKALAKAESMGRAIEMRVRRLLDTTPVGEEHVDPTPGSSTGPPG
jgi:hypothetical protein